MRLKFALILVVFGLIVVSLIGGVSADSCTDDDRIMKLFSPSNSHGALWNDGRYNYDICYSDIFGSAYTGANPHTCTSTNKVLGLFQENNTHAEIPSLDDYNVDVCYGDLDCVSDNSAGASCSDTEREVVVRLYQENNSHISNASDTNYPIKICCKSGAVVPPATGDVYWADMNGEPINITNLSDTVELVVNMSGLAGRETKYTLKECQVVCQLTEGIIRWFDREVEVQTSDEAYTTWITDKKGLYYFIATINRIDYFSINYPPYGILSVVDFQNTPPYTQIDNPNENDVYVINQTTGFTTQIDFNQTSSDPDDKLRLTWDFSDRASKIFDDCLTLTSGELVCSSGNGDTNHSYTQTGYKYIKINAREMPPRSPAQETNNYTGIYVYGEGINVFAIVSEPDFGMPVRGLFVNVNGSLSHAANCSYELLKCEGTYGFGNCKTKTDRETSLQIYCYVFPRDNKLIFNWTFDDRYSKQGNWNSAVAGGGEYVNFIKFFSEPGEHSVKLRVGYEITP